MLAVGQYLGKTRKHFMMLENCCYDFFELATLNMAQQGLFGEVVHTEGAYNHDLRGLCMNDSTGYHDMWRLDTTPPTTAIPIRRTASARSPRS